MIVVDTNVVVRFAVNDDPGQAAIARTLFEKHTVSITRTVALETEWVLRSRYGKGRKQIADYFNKLLALKSVRIEAESAFRSAVAWYAAGDDF
ncbi:MAG: type II toxin-antitoxin system VapC family toxin, partial [Betaproteobacteria bacterium]|nr:type II toxin-antitoxin system VapC family toxin [Betaproteobacteria bacterium]